MTGSTVTCPSELRQLKKRRSRRRRMKKVTVSPVNLVFPVSLVDEVTVPPKAFISPHPPLICPYLRSSRL